MMGVHEILGTLAAEDRLQRHAARHSMRFRDAVIDALDAPHAGVDARASGRAWTKTQEKQRDAALRAMLRDAGERVVNQRRGRKARIEQDDVVERIFENDEIGRRLLASLRLLKAREAIERADGAEKHIGDLMFRHEPLQLGGPAEIDAGVGAAEQQHSHIAFQPRLLLSARVRRTTMICARRSIWPARRNGPDRHGWCEYRRSRAPAAPRADRPCRASDDRRACRRKKPDWPPP